VKLGILTNGRSDLQRSVVKALGFAPLVSAIVVSEEVGCRKPQREIFDIALALVASAPQESIMVGDDPMADIEGASNAGMYPIAFKCATNVGVTAEDMSSVGDEIRKRIRAGA
jgi:putative hydrolase of the HAD superfamily